MRIQEEFLVRLLRVVYYITFVFCCMMILMLHVRSSVVSSRMLEVTKLHPKALDRQLSITFFNFVNKYMVYYCLLVIYLNSFHPLN